jgi:transposase-like protein
MADFVPCPSCGSTNVKRIGYTWWGGALGPRLLNHVKCQSCGKTYNGKTGKSNLTNILIYSAVIVVIVIILLVLLS